MSKTPAEGTDCVFCKIATGSDHGRILAQNHHSLALIPKQMSVKGHVLVVPKQHYISIFDIPEKRLNSVMQFTQEVCHAMRKQAGIDGVNLLHASELAAQQSIKHFHIHIIPRFQGDNIDAWPNFPGSNELLGSWNLDIN